MVMVDTKQNSKSFHQVMIRDSDFQRIRGLFPGKSIAATINDILNDFEVKTSLEDSINNLRREIYSLSLEVADLRYWRDATEDVLIDLFGINVFNNITYLMRQARNQQLQSIDAVKKVDEYRAKHPDAGFFVGVNKKTGEIVDKTDDVKAWRLEVIEYQKKHPELTLREAGRQLAKKKKEEKAG